jgi:chemotaxis protein MotB
MNENNPFSNHVTRTQSAKGSRAGWIAAGVAAVLAVSAIVLWFSSRAQHQRELDALQSKLDEVQTNLANLTAENQTNKDTIGALRDQIGTLQKEKEQVAQGSKSLEGELRSELESKDVTISQLKGKLTVSILDRVMFDSGEAELKPDGESVMRKIAGILSEHPQLAIHVIGHTDNVPIRPTAHTRFASNWELSAARALAAVHFLTEQNGIDPRRVGAVGYGEFRPVADNATADGRARNRRIEVTILPEESVQPEVVAANKVNAETNAPANSN